MKRGTHKVEVLRWIGEHKHNGRTYKTCRVKIVDTGDEYIALRLYNAQGKFIKQFMVEPEASQPVGMLMNWANVDIRDALIEAEVKAFQSLAKYKFIMFGYHAATWVNLNRISGLKLPNPFKKLVKEAREEVELEVIARNYPHLFKD